MLQPTAFAHATTIVMAAIYVICRIFVGIMPDTMFSLMQTWVHTVNFESLKMTGTLPMGSFIWGLVVLTILTWLITFATISLYNSFVGKK